MFYKIFRSNFFPHCGLVGDACDCSIDELPVDYNGDKSYNPKYPYHVHVGMYLYPEPNDDLCTSIETIVEKEIAVTDKHVYAQCFLSYSYPHYAALKGGTVTSQPSLYQGDDVGMDIAADAVYLLNKTISQNLSEREIDDDEEYKRMLDSTTLYIDIRRSNFPLEEYKIEGCPLERFIHKCMMSAIYLGHLLDYWCIHEKFLYLRRLNITSYIEGKPELTYHGRRNRFHKLDLE
jgi:hypothetical protein